MRRQEQGAIASDRFEHREVTFAADIGLDAAGMIGEATDDGDLRQKARERHADITRTGGRGGEDPARRLHHQYESAVGHAVVRQKCRQRGLDRATVGGGKQRLTAVKSAIRQGGDKHGGAAHFVLHARLFAKNAGDAGNRHHRKKSEDQDRDRPSQDGLDPPRRPLAELIQPGDPFAQAMEVSHQSGKMESQPLIGCGCPPRVRHRPCLDPSCDPVRRSPESDSMNHRRFGLSRRGG